MLLFGVTVEKTYGTLFYLALSLAIIVLSNILTLAVYTVMTFYIPYQYRGGISNFYHCSNGYTNVVLGLAAVSSYIGEHNQSVFRLCEIDKKYIPWFYMLTIYFSIPESHFLGHSMGLMVGLMLKFAGLYTLLPRYDWLESFENNHFLDRE